MEQIGSILRRIQEKSTTGLESPLEDQESTAPLTEQPRKKSENGMESDNLSDSEAEEAESNCPRCKGAGFVASNVPVGHPNYCRAVPCKCTLEADKIHRQERYLRLCHLPKDAEDMSFQTFVRRSALAEAYEAAWDIVEGKLEWLTLIGNVDCGKTHLAVAVCLEWLRREKPARYVHVPILLDELRQAYAPGATVSYEEQLDFFKNVGLLVLDDLGTENPTAWAQEKLDMIIDWRSFRHLPLIVTSNLPLNRMSPRIASRLQRHRPGKVIVIEAKEFRLESSKQ